MFDLIFRGAQVLDGRGSPPVTTDVGIRGDRITAIGPLASEPAHRIVEARGRFLCPGFVDVHTHADHGILSAPDALNYIAQGVTTVVGGNCGTSAAPRSRIAARSISKTDVEEFQWRRVGEYRVCVERARPAVNLALLVGHNTIREAVLGDAPRRADLEDLRRMQTVLEAALEEGAWGLSTGLIYSPGRYADRGEILALARIAAACGGLYATHLRSESAGLLAALDEALEIGEAAEIRVQISHLKAAGRPNWSLLEHAVERLDRAVAAGRPLAADRYPYTFSCTRLRIVLPETACPVAKVPPDPLARADLVERMNAEHPPEFWDTIMIAATRMASGQLAGRPLVQVAREWGVSPAEAALRLLEHDHFETTAIFHSMEEKGMWRVLGLPWVMIASDGEIPGPVSSPSLPYVHPRSFGTFARFLRWSLDGRTVSLPEAIRKMTALPAETFRIRGRGILQEGAYADLVLFDPLRVRDVASLEDPMRTAEGFDWIIVNGQISVEEGIPTGLRAGRFLSPDRDRR